MLKQTALRSGLCLMALTLGACSWLKQPAAPAEAGNTQTGGGYSTPSDNPYGSTEPYTPPTGTTQGTQGAQTPYTPPPASGGSGSYVPSYAPVDINAATHTVVRGDTVYNISRRYQISQDNLRAWNNLDEGNNIRIGQVLRVKPAGYTAPAGSSYTPPAQTQTTPPPVNTTQTTPPPPSNNTPPPTAGQSSGNTRSVGGLTWQRPTQGSVLQGFGGNSKGIDFGGSAGQAVVAAADGKVVYSGSGLRGYGNLVIVQHNQTYLTAYGNNQRLLVKEGEQVRRGQQIATMGNSDASRTQLHFELRENGQPVNPTRFLPM